MLAKSSIGGSTIVGTKLAQFEGTNLHLDTKSNWFAIEACEYKRHFLEYTPTIAIITNIDVDHLDYYRDEADYLSAFVSFVSQAKKTVILSGLDAGCRKLYEAVPEEVRNRLDWYFVDMDGYSLVGGNKRYEPKSNPWTEIQSRIPYLNLKVPGEHLRLDANLAFVTGKIIGIPEDELVLGLELYG